jgi:TPR repeat protein
LFSPLAALGNGDPFDLARAAYEEKNYAAARAALEPLAEGGDARAQHLLGLMYEKGRGVGKDFVAAARWYTLAARRGYAPSEYRLAIAYLCGLGGLEKDTARALDLLRRAAEGGYEKAQRVLAKLDAEGGVARLQDGRVAMYCALIR